MTVRITGTVLALFAFSGLYGQAVDPLPAFEVASINPPEGPMHRLGVGVSGQRLTADASNVMMLVMFAYNVSACNHARPHSLCDACRNR